MMPTIPTEDALRDSNARMMETISYLMREVETLRRRLDSLESQYGRHTHTVTYADYDGGTPTSRTATVTTPR